MRSAIVAAVLAAVVTWPAPGMAQLDRLTTGEATAGLKTALEKGSLAAVSKLGRQDGFWGNARVRIPLPDSLQRAERAMRRIGMGKYADELHVAMNRAAESAVPEAKQLFINSVRRMTVQDAKGIVSGGDTAGTEYFRRTTSSELHKRFLPIVQKATAKVALAQKYDRYADRAASLGLIRNEDADLDEYVTRKALDGLYLMVADEEKKIRKDPVGTGSSIIKKVFGALL